MNTPQPMNMRDGTVVSEKMEPVVPALVCRDVKCTKRRFSPSNGGTFTASGSEIRIPISGNFVLDNKNVNLNFKIATTTAAALDFSPVGLFSQIRVEAGAGSSIVLESIDDPAVWANFIYQYTWTQEDISIQSCKQRSSMFQPDGGTTAATIGLLTKTGATLGTTPIDVALDLSLFMGIFSGSSGIPLYNTAGLTLVCTLNTAANAYQAAAAAVMTITEVFVSCSCLEGGEKYEAKLNEMKNSGNKEISVMYNTCRRYIQNIPISTLAINSLLINERSKSCLGFVAIARDTTNISDQTVYSNSNSLFFDYKNHVYNIAGQNYPVSTIATKAEAIDEAYDLYSHLSRRYNSGGLVSRAQGGGTTTGTAITTEATQLAASSNATGPSQVLAVNLSKCGPNENYWGKGMNMSQNNLSTYLQCQYSTFTPQTINIYSVFQMKLHIDALGNMTTEF